MQNLLARHINPRVLGGANVQAEGTCPILAAFNSIKDDVSRDTVLPADRQPGLGSIDFELDFSG